MTKVYNSKGWTLTGVTAVVAMVGSLFILLIRRVRLVRRECSVDEQRSA